MEFGGPPRAPAVELVALLPGAEAPAFDETAAPLPVELAARAPGASPIARWALATARKECYWLRTFLSNIKLDSPDQTFESPSNAIMI